MNETIKSIMQRVSVRKFTADPVKPEDQKAILDAGLAAPSAANRQPWKFLVYGDKAGILEMEKHLVDKAMDGGDETAIQRLRERDYKIFFDAPMLVFVVSKLDGHFDMMDCGIAVENMVIAAQSLGYGSIILGGARAAFLGEKKQHFEQLLEFPEGYGFAAGVAIGVADAAALKAPHELDRSKISYL